MIIKRKEEDILHDVEIVVKKFNEILETIPFCAETLLVFSEIVFRDALTQWVESGAITRDRAIMLIKNSNLQRLAEFPTIAE